MADQTGSDGPDRTGRPRTRVLVRLVLGALVLSLAALRFVSLQDETEHHVEEGFNVGAAFREDLAQDRPDAAYQSTTSRFKARFSQDAFQERVAEVLPRMAPQTVGGGFSYESGFLSYFFRGFMHTEYPIPLQEQDGKLQELRLLIVEEAGVLRVDDMVVADRDRAR